MKKLLVLIACSMFVISCQQENVNGSIKIGNIGDYVVVIIDGCEYLEYDYGRGQARVYALTHKGNCKNHNK